MDRTFAAPPARASARPGRGLALATLSLAVLMVQIDTSVVNLAIHPIGAYFGARMSELQWVLDSYNLVYAALLLTGGLLADLLGRRRVFMAGAGLFGIASMACALAPSVNVLIASLAVAGLAAALIIPASLALIRVVWPDPAERRHALGIWAAANGLALAIGAPLGGVLIHYFGWRGIFVPVVPLAGVALVLAWFVIPESADPRERHFDLAAQILGALVLGGVAFAAIEARERPEWALAVLFLAIISGLGFLRIESRRGSAALVPLEMVGVSAFRGAMLATAAMTFGMYGVLFLVPVTWLGTDHLGPLATGLALMPMALVFVLVSPFSGFIAARLGGALATGIGLLAIASGLFVIAASADRTALEFGEIGLALTGLGMGMATGPLMGAAVGAVAAARAGTASALINVARMIGATVGVAVLGAVYALVGGGAHGLQIAMVVGGSVQVAGAAIAWRSPV